MTLTRAGRKPAGTGGGAAVRVIRFDLELALDFRVQRMTMRYRTLGGTGIEVSVHCLGAMMFGAVGNPYHDECARIIHAALDRGINFVDTADMYSTGESEEIVGRALRDRRDDVVLATKVHFPMGEGRNRSGNSRRWILTEVEESLKAAADGLHRPLPGPPPRRVDRHRGDPFGTGRPGTAGRDPFSPLLDLPRRADRRGALGGRAPRAAAAAHRAAAVLLLARGVEGLCRHAAERMGVLTWSPLASGFLTGRYRRGSEVDFTAGRAALARHRFDPACRTTTPSTRRSKSSRGSRRRSAARCPSWPWPSRWPTPRSPR